MIRPDNAVSPWNRASRILVLAALFFPLKLQSQSSDALETLLRLRQQARTAHLTADAHLLTDGFSDQYQELNRGTWNRPTRADAERRFSNYFASVRFLEWEDARPPIVAVSPDSQWAEVVVNKRVRTIPTSMEGAESAERYVWLERWVRTRTSWELRTIASTDRPEPSDSVGAPLADVSRAWTIIQRSREALGGSRPIAHIAALRFSADCQGPRRPFRTVVLSARDGRVLFAQDFPDSTHYRAGISLAGGWERGPDGRLVDSLGLATQTVVRAHEMLMLALGPESRYIAPTALADQQFDGHNVHVVRFRDAAGSPIDFLYDPDTGRPEAYRPVNHAGSGAAQIVVRFSDWRPAEKVLLPRLITMTAGADVFRYQITEVSTDWIDDVRFRP